MAQLGARVNGIHEVAGSIPASSTKPHFVRTVGPLVLKLGSEDGRRIRFLGSFAEEPVGIEPATRGSKGVRPLRGERARGMVPLSKSR